MRFHHLFFVALLVVLLGVRPSPATADTEDSTAAPVFMIISLAPTFVYKPGTCDGESEPCTEDEFSQTILVNIGCLNPGTSIGGTRFSPATAPFVPLPDGTSLADLDGNAMTVVGSVLTQAPGDEEPQPHMMTPRQAVPEEPIPADIQNAFYLAALNGDLDALTTTLSDDVVPKEIPYFPTTQEIVQAVANCLTPKEGEEGPTAQQMQDVSDFLFGSDQQLAVTEGSEQEPSVVAIDEGDMFPHSPGGAVFHYTISFDDDGTFSSDVCVQVPIDIKPDDSENVVNYKKKGTLKIAILSTDDFDATEIDTSTLKIGSVSAGTCKEKDLNEDGLDDLECDWDVGDLSDAGEIDADTTDLVIVGVLENGVDCIRGTDFITHPTK